MFELITKNKIPLEDLKKTILEYLNTLINQKKKYGDAEIQQHENPIKRLAELIGLGSDHQRRDKRNECIDGVTAEDSLGVILGANSDDIPLFGIIPEPKAKR